MINLDRQMNGDSTLMNGCSFRRSPSLHAKVADSGLNFQIKQYRTERLGLVAIPLSVKWLVIVSLATESH